jgi:hypothetical protein
MKKNTLLFVNVIVMILGVSILNAGGTYSVKPDSKAVTVEEDEERAKNRDTSRFSRGTHRINRLQKFKRRESIRSGFTRMKRKHFIR